MSRSLKYIFPVANASDVCALQTITAPALNLVLNGNLSNQITNQVSFIDYGYSRSISFTSGDDLSARTFTIQGIQNGAPITENRVGPNANTVYSLKVYDKIYSITVDAAIDPNTVSVGTGFLGFFPLIDINLAKGMTNFALSTAQLTVAPNTTTIFNTLENIANNGHTFLDIVANNLNVFTIKASSADAQHFLPGTFCRSILVQINGAAGEIANSIEMNYIET